MPLKVFLNGRASAELDALRRRLVADANLELVDRLELADAVVSREHDVRHRAALPCVATRELLV